MVLHSEFLREEGGGKFGANKSKRNDVCGRIAGAGCVPEKETGPVTDVKAPKEEEEEACGEEEEWKVSSLIQGEFWLLSLV